MLFTNRVTVRVRFSVWLLSGYANVFILLSVVIATLPPIVTFYCTQRKVVLRIGSGSSFVHVAYSYNVFDSSSETKMRKSCYHLTYGQPTAALLYAVILVFFIASSFNCLFRI